MVGKESRRIVPGFYSSGMLGSDPPEHARIGDTDGVTAAISGCANPGMERVVECANVVLYVTNRGFRRFSCG
jgi:7,8-dihydropterin-6-yl-methyl-4-(beta-D-ribofuranosyl)aminobenzene 5'-phosphate synthase